MIVKHSERGSLRLAVALLLDAPLLDLAVGCLSEPLDCVFPRETAPLRRLATPCPDRLLPLLVPSCLLVTVVQVVPPLRATSLVLSSPGRCLSGPSTEQDPGRFPTAGSPQ